jgi:hypothetical protein
MFAKYKIRSKGAMFYTEQWGCRANAREKQLQTLADQLWIYDGCIPFSTRMTVIRMPGNRLWIHSLEELNDKLMDELANLGEVAYLILPNKSYHPVLERWLDAYPSMKHHTSAYSYAIPSLIKKVHADLCFDGELGEQAGQGWANEIAQVLIRGGFIMEEVFFYHKLSQTLVVTDLVKDLEPSLLNF